MTKLIYNVQGNGSLQPAAERTLQPNAWNDLEAGFAQEVGLTAYPREVFETRLESRQCVVALDNNGVIAGTVSALPKITGPIQTLVEPLNTTNLLEIGAVWLRPDMRRIGIIGGLMDTMIAEAGRESIVTSQTFVKGFCTMTDHKLKWDAIDWDKNPFVTALIGWDDPDNDTYRNVSGPPQARHALLQ